jgi:hypothetical protein
MCLNLMWKTTKDYKQIISLYNLWWSSKLNRALGGMCHLLLQGWQISHTRNWHKACYLIHASFLLDLFSDSSVTWCYIPEDRTFRNHCYENLKFYIPSEICLREPNQKTIYNIPCECGRYCAGEASRVVRIYDQITRLNLRVKKVQECPAYLLMSSDRLG